MIEKPKRPKKIPNQDNKQPQTIQELIRRYDLDNTKIYDFLDELVISLKEDFIKKEDILDEYSMEEQVIGTWKGKKIYRKTLTIDAIGTQEQQVWDLTDLNIDTFFVNHNRSNYTTSTPNNYVFPLANNFKDSDQYRVDVLYVKKNKSLYVRTNDLVTIASGYITIEYTKTTD